MSTEANQTPPSGDSSTTDTAAATDLAAAQVPDAVDQAGDNTPTKPGTEASKASSGLADHSKHPPGERAEGARVAVTGSNKESAQ
jgi:hypothetical protein